jgi:hypothetical protein
MAGRKPGFFFNFLWFATKLFLYTSVFSSCIVRDEIPKESQSCKFQMR